MPVLVEATSVIIKRSAIDEKWPGGWESFVRDVPNQTLCADTLLARVGFMNPDDVESYINSLQKKGFIYLSKTDEDDLVVADQLQGLYVNCNWVRFGRVNHEQDSEESVAACIHVDDKGDPIMTPDWWKFEGSLSHTFAFAPSELVDKSLKFLRHENGVDVYLNKLTGEEVYSSRTGEK